MIQKLEKQNKTILNFFTQKKEEDKNISSYVAEIIKIKKFPFSEVYITVPIENLEKFIISTKSSNLDIKDIKIKNNIGYIVF